MKFAYFSHVWNRPDMTVASRYKQLWRELALADELDFDFGFAVEHHFSPHESWMPSPSVFCTAAAAHTRKLRIGPMGYVVPLYDPLRIVEEAAVIDNVSEGRLELGLISGITPNYFTPYKADFVNRRQRVFEAVRLVKKAFSGKGPFSFHGEYHDYDDVQLAVQPVQQPHPPLWVQSRDPETLEFLAKEGVHSGYLFYLPRSDGAPRYKEYIRRWQAAGHASSPNINYWTLVYVDDTDEAALAKAAPAIVSHFQHTRGFGDTGGISPADLGENFVRRGELGAAEIARNMTNPQYLYDNNLVFVGSPATVARRIKEAAQEGLFNTVCAEFNFGGFTEDDLTRSVRRFGEEVIPALRGFDPY